MTVTPTHDLRSLFGPASNQGSRPTCCAFATTDLHAACRPPWTVLSYEYAFFHGIRRQGTAPTRGVFLRYMLEVLEQDGQPAEVKWPYLSALPADLKLWAPPADVGQLFTAKGARTAGNLANVKASIDQGQPILIVMTISDAFYFGPDGDGMIDSAEPTDTSRVHALIGVGYGMWGSDGCTLVRNSWGSSWGLSGYAWLSDRYIAPRILDLATMTKVP